MTLIDHAELTAHKVHRCEWCETDIAVGDRYVRQRCADRGDGAWTWKAHAECFRAFCRLDRYEQEDAHMGTPYTRGCTCDRFDAANCATPEMHVGGGK